MFIIITLIILLTWCIGLNTAGYFYGQPTHKFTTIDMYRRNPTNLPGPIRMEFGRPGEGYYTQKYPGNPHINIMSHVAICYRMLAILNWSYHNSECFRN